MTQSPPLGAPRLEIRRPKHLRLGPLLLINAYGLLLVIPVLCSIILVTTLRFGPLTWLLPVAAILGTLFFLPLGFGNPFVSRLIDKVTAPETAGERYKTQITFSPRLYSGPRALLEDADDIGWLTFSGSEVVFTGDAVTLSLPYSSIKTVRARKIGLGLFLTGCRTEVQVQGIPHVTALEFAERESSLLPAARETAARLFESISRRAAGSAP